MNIDWGNLEEGETDSCLQWDGLWAIGLKDLALPEEVR